MGTSVMSNEKGNQFVDIAELIIGTSVEQAPADLARRAYARLGGHLYKIASECSQSLGYDDPMDIIQKEIEESMANGEFTALVNEKVAE